MYVAQAHGCGTCAHSCVYMYVQNTTRGAHVKMKCKEENGTFHVYYKLI